MRAARCPRHYQNADPSPAAATRRKNFASNLRRRCGIRRGCRLSLVGLAHAGKLGPPAPHVLALVLGLCLARDHSSSSYEQLAPVVLSTPRDAQPLGTVMWISPSPLLPRSDPMSTFRRAENGGLPGSPDVSSQRAGPSHSDQPLRGVRFFIPRHSSLVCQVVRFNHAAAAIARC